MGKIHSNSYRKNISLAAYFLTKLYITATKALFQKLSVVSESTKVGYHEYCICF